MKIAFGTIGILRQLAGHPEVQGFIDRIGAVYEHAEQSSGFLDRSRRDIEAWSQSWGEVVPPKFVGEVDPRQVVFSLSTWKDLESVAAYAYRGAHGEALGQRRDWIDPTDTPIYVAWWVEDDHQPTFREAAARMDELHENGSTARAFDFKQPYDSAGQRVSLDSTKVRAAH